MTKTELRNATIAITGRSNISPAKLHSFDAGRSEAVYSTNGRHYAAVKTDAGWKLTGDYFTN